MAGALEQSAFESQIALLWVTEGRRTSPLPQDHTSHSQSQ